MLQALSVREGVVGLGIRSTLDMLPNLPFNRVGLLDASSGTLKRTVAGSPERPGVKYPLGVSQHPPLLKSRVTSRNLGVAKLGNRGIEMEGWYIWVLWTSPEAQEHI